MTVYGGEWGHNLGMSQFGGHGAAGPRHDFLPS